MNFSAATANGCTKDTTMVLTFNLKPAFNYPALNAVCENAPALSIANATVTNGVTGTGTYSGPGTDAAGTFTPSIAGYGIHTIWYRFTSTAGCIDSVSQSILVHARPRTRFDYSPSTGCLSPGGTVSFTNNTTIPDGQLLTWLWTFNDPNANAGNPNTSTTLNPTHNYLEGTYNINLQATTSNGCTKDTTVTATLSVTPALSYPVLAAVCENAPALTVASATVTNGVTGTGVYSGPGTNASGMFNPAIAGYGTHTITYTFTSAGGCVETTTQNILVHAKPRTAFSFPSGSCLPPAGSVTFNNTTNIPDAQPATWLWDFNDPNANAGNPNTSAAFSPSHNFGEGIFNVKLTATTSNGCMKDTTITATFKVTPAVAFPVITAVCNNPGAPAVSVATATVTNNVTGAGVYSGPGTTAAGVFDPNIAGAGTHTITYTFTTAGGCVGTATSTIEVYPRPVADVTAGGGVCFGDPVTISSASGISSGTVTTWNWNLGNGTTPSYSNGNPFTVNYTAAGTYTVTLTNISDKGCVSIPDTQYVLVNPLPDAAFILPTGICMPGGSASFTNQSSIPGNGVLSYAWTFGDGGTSAAANPTHVYAAINSYSVMLTVTSAAGCVDAESKTLNASEFYNKPVADFSASPAEICLGETVAFQNNSSAPNSTIQSSAWTFGDGSSSAVFNPPPRQYNTAGQFIVNLTVTNAVGCKSDPYPQTVIVHLLPKIDAGSSYVLPQGTQVQLNATSNSSGFAFNWSPGIGLSSTTILNPTMTAVQDQVYTLVATGDFGCTATDFMTVKVLKPVKVPNIFTPNGDNIHDRWLIPNLEDYPGCTVEVFNRYGQQVFYSTGYSVSWDGTYKGKEVPAGAYYYVIQLQNGFKPLTGSLTILR
ncbi:MAG: PKD domain-containing protein [Chitinophagaceae bacterium]|nr:PKD domain-containing protein [Chitinophagaceae bacterium]